MSRQARCACGTLVTIPDWMADGLRAMSSVLEARGEPRLRPGEAVACPACAPQHRARAVERAAMEERCAVHALAELEAGRLRPEDVPDMVRRGHGGLYHGLRQAQARRRR